MQQIDDAVLPILEAKIRLGLFEHPFVDEAEDSQVLNAPEHAKNCARTAVQRSVVLLRNEQSTCCRWTNRTDQIHRGDRPARRCRTRSARHVGRDDEAWPDGQHRCKESRDKVGSARAGRVRARAEHPPGHSFVL